MDEQRARSIGVRVRAARAANRQTQVVVAGLAGITTDYLYQIERGKKLPTISVLADLAQVLNVPVSSLLDDSPATPPQPCVADTGAALYRALTSPAEQQHDPPPLPTLDDQIRGAWRIWQTSALRYSMLGHLLPGLVADTELTRHRHQSAGSKSDQHAAQRCAVDLYGLLRTVAKRVGRLDLALLVADRAIRSAELADDAHRLAAARWNLAHVLLADGRPDGAEDVAMQAAGALTPLVSAGDIDAIALSGALTLLGAVASVRQGDVWQARQRIRAVAPLAKRTGERNVQWTVFGPTNVAMYAVSVEVEAGDATEGLRLAERVDHDRSPSIERRVAFLLEQAKGYTQRREFGNALVLLQAVGREAPEDAAYRPTARQLVQTVVQRGRRGVAAEAARLAQHVGVAIA
jgi:transcriptional regulator with XRE-family HTH domain